MTVSSLPATDGTTSVEGRIRAARVVLDNCGHRMSQSKLSRLIRTYTARVEANGFSFFDYLANAIVLDAQERRRLLDNPDVARVIAYSDPTGETAVSRVMRERGR